jgi:release factor glutamine methyltransferase
MSDRPSPSFMSETGDRSFFVVTGAQLWDWWQSAQKQAIAANVPLYELEWLLDALCGIDRLALRLGSFKHQPELKLSLSLDALDERWQQRWRDRVPVQYIAGAVSWRNLSLAVSPAVLIPRPETEQVIDEIAAIARQFPRLADGVWLDLGTGSGAIAIGLATIMPNATIYAVDISVEALAIAQQNAQQCQVSDRIHFCQGSWFEALPHERRRSMGWLSGMVSNPPYIPTADLRTLQPEVQQHEPHLALDGGLDGLDCIRHLAAIAPQYLTSGGVWLTEMMDGQADAVQAILAQTQCYREIQIRRDWAQIDRFALAFCR